MKLLSTAIALAAEKHKNQTDKAGMPYILHTLKVMHYLKTDDQELMIIAVLHDIVEDTDITFKDLQNMGFSTRVIDGIRRMTKMPGQTLEEYMEAISGSMDSIRVKLCDLRHNMDPRRLKGVTEKDAARMDKYSKMYWTLKELRNMA